MMRILPKRRHSKTLWRGTRRSSNLKLIMFPSNCSHVIYFNTIVSRNKYCIAHHFLTCPGSYSPIHAFTMKKMKSTLLPFEGAGAVTIQMAVSCLTLVLQRNKETTLPVRR